MAKAIISPLLERGEYLPQQVLGIVGSSSSITSALNDLPKETSPAPEPAWGETVATAL